LLEDHDIGDIPTETLCGLSEAALFRRDASRALEKVQQALALVQNGAEMRMEESIALRLCGLASLNLGGLSQAETYFLEGLQVAEEHQIAFEVGRTLVALAQICNQTGRKNDALAHLARALDIFTAMKAAPFIEQTQHLSAFIDSSNERMCSGRPLSESGFT
jgi:tetratricopeptide (TPR) repeat protein